LPISFFFFPFFFSFFKSHLVLRCTFPPCPPRLYSGVDFFLPLLPLPPPKCVVVSLFIPPCFLAPLFRRPLPGPHSLPERVPAFPFPLPLCSPLRPGLLVPSPVDKDLYARFTGRWPFNDVFVFFPPLLSPVRRFSLGSRSPDTLPPYITLFLFAPC